MDPRVRGLYKKLLFLARDYPRGISEARRKLRAAFTAPLKGSLDEAIAKGDYVTREVEALIYLTKYRALLRRYSAQPPTGAHTPPRGGPPRSAER